ncbi:MAG: sulfoxide reductase heme-binding subunit YedZ [Rhizobiales bacterium]|nr:sulfoxide reductase heme-binding subunit YedZ [Hyphomicrobiales bacterium]
MAFLREKNGRWSPEKIAAFVVAVLPALWLLGRFLLHDLGARPITEAIHFTGEWAVRLLLLSLLISPARRILGAGKLILARRTLGVAAMAYALLHLSLYILDQKFNLFVVASEIALRFYLTIGFVALIGLIALGTTSFDAVIRRMGPRWNTLHRIVYGIAILAIIHFLLQKKLEIYEPTVMAGLLLWLFGYRLWQRLAGAAPGWIGLTALAFASALLTAAVEALWFGVKTGVDPWLVLDANWALDIEIRPAWWVLAVTLAVVGIKLVTDFRSSSGTPRQRMSVSTARG